MSNYITVGTMNIQNKYKITDYDGLDETGNDNAQLLNRFLIENSVDVIGTQELVREFIDRIKKTITPQYKLYGKFRFGSSDIVKKIEIFDRFNETVSIISRHPVLRQKTYTLPWIPRKAKYLLKSIKETALRPRVATVALVNIKDFGKVNFINTHLDHKIESIQIRQMNFILNLIKKSKYPVILTGDFNMTTNMSRFNNFIENLKNIGYKRVENNKTTWKYQQDKLPIDHIFIPQNWNVDQIVIGKENYLEKFSDHYPLLVRISK